METTVKKRVIAAAASMLIAGGLSLGASAGAATSDQAYRDPAVVGTHGVPTGPIDALHRWCAQRMHDAVVEDNAAYEAKDADRYEAVLNPDMLFVADGEVTYGRDAVMETARQSFAVPGWHWNVEILSETTYGCATGVAVLLASLETADWTRNYHVTMTMTQNWGTWTVAMDGVHLLETIQH